MRIGCRVFLRCGLLRDVDDLLLGRDLAHVAVVDGFGRPYEAARGPDAALCLRGRDATRVAASVGVRSKAQLAAFGGFGYGYAAALGLPPDCLGRVAAPALFWAKKPKKPKVDTVTLRCTLCAATFEVRRGEHYGKFDFVYCGRACLARHRDLNFDAAALLGPTAAAQGV